MYRENGTLIKGVGNDYSGHLASSKGYSKGKHTWKIKNILGGIGYRYPCVLTNPNGQRETHVHIYGNSYKGNSYVYFSNNECLGQYVNGIHKWALVDNIPPWEKGETVTILLDCDRWKLGFWNGETKLGVIDILPNLTYYPGFETYSHPQNEFKLIKE